jgi:hypothetical protein
MKKTLKKLGVLAFALVLTMMFVACAQPTDEEGDSGVKAPTIIRLYLDRDDGTIDVGDSFEIRVGEDLLIPAAVANYPGAANVDSAGVTEPGNKTGPIEAADRNKVIAIPWNRTSILVGDSVIKAVDPKKDYLVSGAVVAAAPVVGSADPAGGNIQVNAKGIYYIDVPLVNQTIASKDRGSIFSGSISGYVELALTSTTLPAANAGQATTYLYTKDKHGFNDLWKMDGLIPLWKTTNSNIKKVSLKSGINELYLSYFSYDQFGN